MHKSKTCLVASFHDTVFARELAQTCQTASNYQSYAPILFEVGHCVWLDRRYSEYSYTTAQLSRKLSAHQRESFSIIELIAKNELLLPFTFLKRPRSVVQIERITPYYEQSKYIHILQSLPAQNNLDKHGDQVVKIKKKFAH